MSNNYGFKVSRDGYDSGTASDEQLAFNSKFFLQKIAQQGSITVTVNSGATGYGTVAHNLGYVPSWLAWCRSPYYSNTTVLAGEDNSSSYADGTKLYFKGVNSLGATKDFIFYYYIFIDDGQ